MGNPNEGLQYWNKIPDIEKESYLKTNNDPSFFVKEKLKWGPVSVANYVKFIQYLNNTGSGIKKAKLTWARAGLAKRTPVDSQEFRIQVSEIDDA